MVIYSVGLYYNVNVVVRVIIYIGCCNMKGIVTDGFIIKIFEKLFRPEIVLFASCVGCRSVTGRRD